MAYRVSIKVLRSDPVEEGPPTLSPETGAFVTFIPTTDIREDPPEDEATGYEPFWPYDWQPETYKHEADGHYVPDPDRTTEASEENPALDPQPGEWLVVAAADDRAPVSQRLTLVESRGRLLAVPGWKSSVLDKRGARAANTAATVDIVNFKKGKAAKEADHVLITLTLWPREELVFMAGTSYHKKDGTRFIKFAEIHRNRSYRRKRIHAGTRVAQFDCETGTRYLVAKAHRGWMAAQQKQASFADSGKFQDDEKVDRSQFMGVLQLYEYLDALGEEAPKSVREVGFFSHSFRRGPILWNTNDEPKPDQG